MMLALAILGVTVLVVLAIWAVIVNEELRYGALAVAIMAIVVGLLAWGTWGACYIYDHCTQTAVPTPEKP